jgi:hypothetical protein
MNVGIGRGSGVLRRHALLPGARTIGGGRSETRSEGKQAQSGGSGARSGDFPEEAAQKATEPANEQIDTEVEAGDGVLREIDGNATLGAR